MTARTYGLLVVVLAFGPLTANGAGQNALILNEANAVSGSKYLENGKFDPNLGRLQGNGQNWLEFLVVDADPGKNTLDLRGWSLNWQYAKTDDPNQQGNGVMTFSQDPVWSAVPRGTMITVSEWQNVWYLTDTPAYPGNPGGDPDSAGGLQRDGGTNGFGTAQGNVYNPAVHSLLDLSTNTVWNPLAQTGADWNIHVWAGDRNATNQFKYFSFSGSVRLPDGGTPAVGVDQAAGLFATNNDEWQITIKDASNNTIQGPIGEHLPGWVAGGVNSQEVVKLEAFDATFDPTLADYQGATIGNYADGSSSTFESGNQWNSGVYVQDLSPLRSWFASISPGDVNLDGVVNIFDINQVSANWGPGNGGLGGDANGDGNTDIFDINVISANWLSGGSAHAVPEPAAAWLLLGGAAALLAAVWRRWI
jgi:hypothetical protein